MVGWGTGGGGVEIELVEQLSREVCNISIFGVMLLGKKHDVAQSDIVYAILKLKKSLGIMPKKLKRGLRACRLKMGGLLKAAISNKAKLYLSQNYNKKSNFIVRFPSALYNQIQIC